ncbi:MAG: succinylglutamate desuccinylase/aspartoacylase family protein [Planctomycetota bacterium]|nr:succinylglutamate desuccinylase/aspartoacylase family protein [Planctomycetota bacterium]MDA1177205.1 succinylglutamate desuccinylase/aspartoacylase family protein [Planctomycetota bacterium]
MNLLTRRIIGNMPGPRLLILGGIHGDEFEPMVAARELLQLVRSDQLHGSLTVVPVVNEPAFLRGHRTADDGLDLARTFPGRADGSITEQIAHATTNLIQDADFVIDLHTGGTQLAARPLVGYMLHSDPDVLKWQRRMARAFGLPVIWGTSADLHGRSLSACRDANVPAIYAEYQGAAVCRESGVRAYVDGCLQVMSELKMLPHIDRQPLQEPLVVEDARPSSGHLQICNPAPCTGYWRRCVELDQQVGRGDKLGTISDVLGDNLLPILAEQTGIVIVLRTYPRVFQGDALAVILERP